MNECEIALTMKVRVKDPFPPEGAVDDIREDNFGQTWIQVVRTNAAGEEL